jgi:hypothetical protein
MRKFAILLGIVLVFGLAACDDDQPPTQVYIVLSPTPEPQTVTDQPAEASPTAEAEATSTVTTEPTDPPTAAPTSAPTTAPTTPPAPTNTQEQVQAGAPTNTQPPPPPAPTDTIPASTATPLPALFPTNTVTQVQMAEQVFENGRMFWIRHNLQIWVMLADPEQPTTGDWLCYNDTFQEGEMEIDPDIVPPEGLIQPRRGFGKLWRTYEEIRGRIGWATTPEFELTSNYTYLAGGYVEDGQYFPGPGEHRLTTIFNDQVSFFEREVRGDCMGGTYRMVPAQ